ncbi:MAG: hypothetical protein IPG16_12485 [Comamonadaceae bacterium]|nr:hypothetical protein [Comamonadaceae bacterium]
MVGHVLGVRDDLLPASFDDAAASFERMQAFGRAQTAAPDARPGPRAGPDAGHGAGDPPARHPCHTGSAVPVADRTGQCKGHRHWRGGALADPARLRDRPVSVAVAGPAGAALQAELSLSRMLVRVVGYHLLKRFLLDQTRPLGLPEQVLDPMRVTVAAWHDEPRAPRLAQPGGRPMDHDRPLAGWRRSRRHEQPSSRSLKCG